MIEKRNFWFTAHLTLAMYKADLYYVEGKVPKKEKEKTKYVLEKRNFWFTAHLTLATKHVYIMLRHNPRHNH